MTMSSSPFQQAIVARLLTKKTWNIDVLKARVKWEYSLSKGLIPADELQGEIDILAAFVKEFGQSLIKNRLGWLPATNVVTMYQQAIADSKPFELEGL